MYRTSGFAVGLLLLWLMAGAGLAGVTPLRPGNPPAAATRPELAPQIGHSSRLRSLAFSPDGRHLVTAAEDWTLKLWDCRTGELLRSAQAGGSWAPAFCYTPDGSSLALLAGDGIQFRDAETLRLKRTLPNRNQLSCLVVSQDGSRLAVGCPGETVTLWELPSGKELRTFRAHVGWVGNVALSADGGLLACDAGRVGISGKAVEVWDTRNGILLHSRKSSGDAHALAFSPDRTLLAVGSGSWLERSCRVELWDVTTGMLRRSLVGHTADILSVGFSRDGTRLASADTSGTIKLWDPTSGKVLRSLAGSGLWTEAKVSADAAIAASVNADKEIQLYELETGKPLARLPGFPYTATTARLLPDGNTLALGVEQGSGGTAHGAVLLWDLRTGNWKGTLAGEESIPTVLAVSADGTRLAAGCQAGTLVLWDVPTRKRLAAHVEKGRTVETLAFLPDGSLAVGGERERTGAEEAPFGRRLTDPFLELWAVPALQRSRSLPPGETWPSQLVADPDEGLLYAAGADGRVRSWDLGAPKAVPRNAFPGSGRPEWLTLSEGGLLACGTAATGELQVWSLRARRMIRKLPAEKEAPGHATVDRRGEYVVWDGSGAAPEIRETARGGRVVLPWPAGFQKPVWYGFASQRGRMVTAEANGALRVWDLRVSRLLATIQLLPRVRVGVEWVAYTPEGFYAASPGGPASLRWRTREGLTPAAAYERERDRPDQVQTALTGAAQPQLFAELSRQEAELRRHLPAPAAPAAVEQPEPARTPTERLRRALTTEGMLGDPDLQRQVTLQIREALGEGADPNTAGGWGTTALMFFAATGELRDLRGLIAKNVELNRKDVYGQTALLAAVSGEHMEAADLLLAAGAEFTDKNGISLLKLQGAALNVKLLEILGQIESGWKGGTLDESSEPTAALLLRLGADPNARDHEGRVPLQLAQSEFLFRSLLERGANPNIRNKEGQTPLISAALTGQTEIAKLLIKHGARVDTRMPGGYSALMYSAQNGHEELAKHLLQHGADPNQQSAELWTPLTLAISGGHLGITRLLLDRHAKLETRGYEGWTPLCYAVSGGDSTVVRLLLARKANPRVRTANGKTLLQLARESERNGKLGIRELLVKAGAR